MIAWLNELIGADKDGLRALLVIAVFFAIVLGAEAVRWPWESYCDRACEQVAEAFQRDHPAEPIPTMNPDKFIADYLRDN